MNRARKVLAWVLALCLTLGALPIMGPPAAAATVNVGSNLLDAYNRASPGDTLVLTGNVILTEPLRVDKNITISGTGTIMPNSNFVPGTTTSNTYNSMIIVTSGTLTVEHGVTFDGDRKCRAIEALGSNSKVFLNGCTIKNCYLAGSLQGAGICINKGVKLEANAGTQFINCKGETGSATGGGALYVGKECEATLDDVTFSGNEANSGGAIYVFESFVSCTANTKFLNNKASQRGGAIHNHGTVIFNGTNQITGNTSGQYGGAVYVSASDTDIGRLVLNNAIITGNTASNSGGGVFIADTAEVYVGGSTKVTGNQIPDPDKAMASNLFAATSKSKIIAYSKLTCSPKELGVSTSNPYKDKVLVYSLDASHELSGKTTGGVTIPASYTMTATTGGDMSKFVYDSDVYLLKQSGTTGNMWLTYNPNVGGGGSGPKVIFDYNLPGAAATVYPDATTFPSISTGDKIPLPGLTDTSVGSVDFKFLGWFSDASGGTKYTTDITVQEGTRVYYAQWDVGSGGGSGTPAPGDLFTVFWDYNYVGGGVTSSLLGTFKLSTTVTVTANGSSAGGSVSGTATETQTKDVTVAFSIPKPPVRYGYAFKGWALTPTASTGTNSPATPTVSTTYYAVWAASDCTLTWDANGGTGGTTTTQKYDTTAVAPTTPPTRTGYKFTGWFIDKPCALPLVSGTIVRGAATFYAGWEAKEYEITWSANYTGGGMTTTQQRHNETLVLAPTPVWEGHIFRGWYTSATGGNKVTASDIVTGDASYYAHWTDLFYTLTWDANSGTPSSTTQQNYGTIITPPTTPPTKTGYVFTGWYIDEDCKTPLTHGTTVTQDATFYAGWEPEIYTVTWDVNYTGGSVTTIEQKYDEALLILPNPVRTGYDFGGWYTGNSGSGIRAEAYGTIKGNATFYANWVQGAIDYTVTVDWVDQSDNDAVRPSEISVELTRNDLPTGLTYTLTAADADASGNKWSHTFNALPQTDSVSNEYTYSVAITSPVSSEYTYGIENKSATLGYILMTHTLIERDVNVFLAWDDAGNRDGLRPLTVQVQLLANGVAVPDGEAVTTLSGTGDAWSYTFHGFQKYFTDGANKGQEIVYGISAMPTAPGALNGYTIDYSDYSATLHHEPETTSATAVVVWADSNNQDGKRPASMFVQLYADNVPLADKYVLLSEANAWGYTWEGLYKYADGGREVVYTAHVTSTLVDYTAATTGMTIEMTYVPSSTTITAFATWQDGNDVDGLRPETLTVELYADGVATGNRQALSPTNGWTTAWKGYPIYNAGSRIEYTFQVVGIPTGYDTTYNGIYDTSGLSVVLTHARTLAPVTVTLEWDDQNDIALARPSRVKVMLYADGTPLPEQTAILDAAGSWEHIFDELPVYRDSGTAIRYTAYVASEVGRYVPSTNGTTITMGYKVETVDVPLVIKWSDANDADGLRPDYIVVTLTIDGQPTAYQSMATAENEWTVVFKGMAAYSNANPGTKINYGVTVTAPAGYSAIYAGTYCVLTATPTTTSVTPIIHWDDHDDQYGQRPVKLTVTLLADDVSTGKTSQVYAADEWVSTSFTGLPKFSGSREIVYSAQVAGSINNYDVTVAGMDVYLSHKAAGEGYTMDYTATVVWADNCNALSTRPTSAELTLYADEKAYDTYTLTNEDIAGLYLWSHTFTDLPTKSHGANITYSVGLSWVPHYKASVNSNTITLTQTVGMKVTATWADNSNVDNKRPAGLTLRLLADGLDTDKTMSMAGGSNSWVTVFEDLPVWSTANTTQQVKYSYRVDTLDASALAAAKYSIDYHSYELGAGSSATDTLLYRMTLTRPKDSSGGGSSGGGNTGGGSGGGGSSGGSSSGSSSTGGGSKTVQASAYITGYSDGTFKPDAAIARCEAAAIMARVSNDYDPSITYPVTFSDVPAKAWYRNYLGYCVSAGIITGYSDGTFKPMSNIDRGEFSAMAARFLGLEKKDKASGFKDVPASYWAEGYIFQLSQRGIINGDGKGNFMPTSPISRAEVVKIVNGILSRKPDKATLQELIADRWFFDVNLKHWAYYEIAEAAYAHKHN